jgi:hypothetical protein
LTLRAIELDAVASWLRWTRMTNSGMCGYGPLVVERSTMGTDRLEFHAEDANAVLLWAREVMTAVLSQDDWPSIAAWRDILPSWFVSACGPEQTRAESETWLRYWRSLAQQERSREADRRWALSDWLYWFDPAGANDERSWAWWDAGIYDGSRGWVEIEVHGHPYPSGALRWLLKASGATLA